MLLGVLELVDLLEAGLVLRQLVWSSKVGHAHYALAFLNYQNTQAFGKKRFSKESSV